MYSWFDYVSVFWAVFWTIKNRNNNFHDVKFIKYLPFKTMYTKSGLHTGGNWWSTAPNTTKKISCKARNSHSEYHSWGYTIHIKECHNEPNRLKSGPVAEASGVGEKLYNHSLSSFRSLKQWLKRNKHGHKYIHVISNNYSYHVSSQMYDGNVLGLDRYILSSFSMSISVYFRTAISLAISDQNYERPAIRDPYHKALINSWLKSCKNCHCCNHISNDPSRVQIRTCYDSSALMVCAKLWSDLIMIFFMWDRHEFLQDFNYEPIHLVRWVSGPTITQSSMTRHCTQQL